MSADDKIEEFKKALLLRFADESKDNESFSIGTQELRTGFSGSRSWMFTITKNPSKEIDFYEVSCFNMGGQESWSFIRVFKF